MSAQDLLITGGYVVTLDTEVGDLAEGDVLVRDGRIAAVGPSAAKWAGGDARRVDAQGRLVIPGMVDAHRHVWQGALGGSTGDASLMGYMERVVGNIAPGYTEEDVYAGTLWGSLQALSAGVTTVADWSHNLRGSGHADADIRALHDSGIRGIFLHGGPGEDTAGFFGEPAQGHPIDAARVRDEHFPNGAAGRLRMGLALRGTAFTSEKATAADFAFARALGVPISVHVGMAGFPDTVSRLDSLGLLGPDVNYAHANQLTERELELIADSGGTIAISSTTEMLMALGTYPATGAVLRHGIPAGLSVDTTTSSGVDLFSEMRLTLAGERSRASAEAVVRHEAVAQVELDQRDMLRLATVGGARAWHLDDEIGTLTVGKHADIVLVDMRAPHLDGFGDPVATMVFGAGPADVEMVIVGGEIVKAGGRLVGPHAETARELIEISRRRIRERAAA
ncbi:amidohydrolase family protein [Amycolatopsis sp. NPDC023774]|uniref:amidohydrolase family protein n=1 Tax=Amycolatopsis sp. NPDC023774 TaxID=3155015 RepID=UPI003403EC5E